MGPRSAVPHGSLHEVESRLVWPRTPTNRRAHVNSSSSTLRKEISRKRLQVLNDDGGVGSAEAKVFTC